LSLQYLHYRREGDWRPQQQVGIAKTRLDGLVQNLSTISVLM
jgi:hypothetical protein